MKKQNRIIIQAEEQHECSWMEEGQRAPLTIRTPSSGVSREWLWHNRSRFGISCRGDVPLKTQRSCSVCYRPPDGETLDQRFQRAFAVVNEIHEVSWLALGSLYCPICRRHGVTAHTCLYIPSDVHVFLYVVWQVMSSLSYSHSSIFQQQGLVIYVSNMSGCYHLCMFSAAGRAADFARVFELCLMQWEID